jgi:phenylpropionate dioxygenase-like ring-hydroxylating dioxygenase large terminal subunit
MEIKPLFLKNLWYYALSASQLKSGQTVAKILLNEPILFGRTQSGQCFALRDICPHRAVPLSCGRFDGVQVECAYHGWRFDPTGQCKAIPALTADQTLDLTRYGVKSYPVQESQGNLWIYMSSDGEKPDPIEPAPQVPEFGDRGYQSVHVMRFPCFLDHAIVGLMDPAHVPFVHRAWWWRSDPTLLEEVKAFVPSPHGFTMQRHQLERQTFLYRLIGGTPEVEISFRLPGIRIEQIITQKHIVCNLTTMTPISETETEVTTMFYTTLPWFPVLQPFLQPFFHAFLNQDREMVAKQQIGLKYNPPLLLIKDADTQALWYYQLKTEFAKAMLENRPFQNPVRAQVIRWRS